MQTVERIRKQLVEEGFEAVLQRKKYRQKVSRRKIDGDVEAHLIALSCSEAPEGYSQWSLRLLAEKMVELGYIESISHEAIRRASKKNELKPWLCKQWCIPPKSNAAFVCAMEDVLTVYKRTMNPDRPVVCMDETSKQLIKETRRLLDRLGIHYTPKHGSWLNIAEVELSVLTRQCSNRRIPDKAMLTREVAAWEKYRNAAQAKVDWRFTTSDARIKLKKLYPTLLGCHNTSNTFIEFPGCSSRYSLDGYS